MNELSRTERVVFQSETVVSDPARALGEDRSMEMAAEYHSLAGRRVLAVEDNFGSADDVRRALVRVGAETVRPRPNTGAPLAALSGLFARTGKRSRA